MRPWDTGSCRENLGVVYSRARPRSVREGGARRPALFTRPSLPSLPRERTRQRLCLAFSYFLPLSPSFSFLFSPFPPFHHFPSEALPPGRGRAGLTPRLSPAPAALWREGAPSSPGHQRRQSEEPDRRRRPRAQGHHGISSLTDPSAAAVRPARVPAPAGPVRPLLPPQSARPLVPRAPLPRAEDHEVVTGPRMTPRHHCEAYSSAGEEEEEEEEEKKVATSSWVTGRSKGIS